MDSSNTFLAYFKVQFFKVDAIVSMILLAYAFTKHMPDLQVIAFNHQARTMVELFNLIFIGFVERWFVLPLLHFFDESVALASQLRFQKELPFEKISRDKDYHDASQKPWFHNKFAVLWTIFVLVPLDKFFNQDLSSESNHETTIVLSSKELVKQLFWGLIVIDLILGTAHLASHRGPLKKFLFKLHAHHHERHQNFPAVKYVGSPFDFEVFLTQVCFAFIPRILGFNVITGVILINIFSLQLILEHTGYRIFHLAQHHEAHHRFGSVAFYHFPLLEMMFGKMPTFNQLQRLSNDGRTKLKQ